MERTPDAPDRPHTVITTRGMDAMRAVLRRRREATTEILAAWDGDDLRTLAHMFTRYNQAVADHYRGPAPGARADGLR
ncbi:hypothetical protein [Streptomyces sp. NPDC058424]|uniref:hypothetical protein n=1 Tax=Streptomyces sp. NPDC058424 TaxID=3346491 RepID=UPI00364FFC44